MNQMFRFFYKKILFIVYFIHIDYCNGHAEDLRKQDLTALIEELHTMYKDAFENEKPYITRRLFTNDGHSYYTLHVQKLKDVNGVKTHNLILEGRSQREDPIIYINNPVEARMPNPFLSIDEFKNAMFERVEKQKKEFDINRNLLINANKQYKVFKHLQTRGNHKVNKKIKQKDHVSRTQRTKIHHIMTTTALIKVSDAETESAAEEDATESTTNEETTTEATTSNEMNTEVTNDENITTGTPVDEEVMTETVSDELNITQTIDNHGITVEATAYDGITTGTPVDEEVITEKVSDEKNTTETTGNHDITAKATPDDGKTMVTIADEDVNTETTAAEKINTEMITEEEIVTEPVTTTEPTVRTTRTKQLRPFVFVGER